VIKQDIKKIWESYYAQVHEGILKISPNTQASIDRVIAEIKEFCTEPTITALQNVPVFQFDKVNTAEYLKRWHNWNTSNNWGLVQQSNVRRSNRISTPVSFRLATQIAYPSLKPMIKAGVSRDDQQEVADVYLQFISIEEVNALYLSNEKMPSVGHVYNGDVYIKVISKLSPDEIYQSLIKNSINLAQKEQKAQSLLTLPKFKSFITKYSWGILEDAVRHEVRHIIDSLAFTSRFNQSQANTSAEQQDSERTQTSYENDYMGAKGYKAGKVPIEFNTWFGYIEDKFPTISLQDLQEVKKFLSTGKIINLPLSIIGNTNNVDFITRCLKTPYTKKLLMKKLHTLFVNRVESLQNRRRTEK